MPLEDDIHDELSGFTPEVIAILEAGGFWDIEGEFDPVEFIADIPKRAKDNYKKESEKKNSRIWGLVKAGLINSAISVGISAFNRDYKQPLREIETPLKRLSPQDFMTGYVKSEGGKFITNMGKTDQKKLVNFIWSNAGQDERVLAKMINQKPHLCYALDQGRHRVETIVRTEKFRATEYGTYRAAKSNKFNTKTRWSAGDKRVRPSHRALHGITVGINEAFPNGEYYPGENSINCRCRVEYGFDVNKIDKNATKTYEDNLKWAEEAVRAERQSVKPRKVSEKPIIPKVAGKTEIRKSTEPPVIRKISSDVPKDFSAIDLPSGGKLYFPSTTEGKLAAQRTIENFNSIPNALKPNNLKITLSNEKNAEDEYWSKVYGRKFVSDASANPNTSSMIKYSQSGKPEIISRDTILHESAHIADKNQIHSGSKKWLDAVERDGETVFASGYGKDAFEESKKYVEDFAESVKRYVSGDKNFREECPARSKYIENYVVKESIPARDLAEEMIEEFQRRV